MSLQEITGTRDVDHDPLQRRMRGYAIHGNTPFDVPYISEVEPGLYHGGCITGLVLPDNIRHVVSLYRWEEYTVEHDLDSTLTVRMYDSDGEVDENQVIALAAWVNICRERGPTLVHCQAGLNRSSLIVGAALILSGRSADEAVELIRTQRSGACLCNSAFERALQSIDRRMQEEGT